MGKATLIITLFCAVVLPGWAQAPNAPSIGTTVPPVGNAQVGDCDVSTCRNAPVRENLSTIDIKVKHVQAILDGFQQGAGFGGGVQLTTADAIPHLELRANALTTTKLYQRYDLEAYAHDILDSRNDADVWFSYLYRREDNFFGIGPRFPRTMWTDFAAVQRSYQGTFTHTFTDHFQAGLYTQFSNTNAFNGKSNNTTPIGDVFSANPEPNPELWAPGLFENTKLLTFGGFFEFDARNNDDGLTRGANVYGRVDSVDGMNDQNAEADFGWVEAVYDARAYIPLGTNKTSLALRSRGQFLNPRGGSQIPFYLLPWLGGREYVRGYQTYRFRGNSSLLFATELRQTVYTKSDTRGVDVFAFADSGQVWGDARAGKDPTLQPGSEFSSSNWHSGVGGGFQYRHSKSIAARAEFGHSNERTLVYLSLSRGF
jgi:Omp85 superfamily domain